MAPCASAQVAEPIASLGWTALDVAVSVPRGLGLTGLPPAPFPQVRLLVVFVVKLRVLPPGDRQARFLNPVYLWVTKHMIAGRKRRRPKRADSRGNQEASSAGFWDTLARCTTDRETPSVAAASRTDMWAVRMMSGSARLAAGRPRLARGANSREPSPYRSGIRATVVERLTSGPCHDASALQRRYRD